MHYSKVDGSDASDISTYRTMSTILVDFIASVPLANSIVDVILRRILQGITELSLEVITCLCSS